MKSIPARRDSDVVPAWLRQLLTLNDNRTADIYPILLVLLTLGFIALCIYATRNGINISPVDYGLGGAALLGGGSAAKRLDKDQTEVEDLSGTEKP